MKLKTLIAGLALALCCAGRAHATSFTNLPSTAAPKGYDVVPASFTFVACDAVNGNSFANTGHELLVVLNSDTAAHSVTVASVPDSVGRTGDSTKNINAGAYYVFQFFPATGWVQTDGTVHVTCSDATIKYALLKFP